MPYERFLMLNLDVAAHADRKEEALDDISTQN